MGVLAFDVGGANIKVADGKGFAKSIPFALWQQPQRLAEQLHQIVSQSPPCERIVATMTGELADCYPSKRDGVSAITGAVVTAGQGRQTAIYLVGGRIVTPRRAVDCYQLAAAANWHALATYALRFTRSASTVLVDIGSTTCDVIPLIGGKVAARGSCDTERLLHGELVYAGIERTPVCAMVRRLPYRGRHYPIAREVFATTRDVYLVTGELDEDSTDCETADGRPATRDNARVRLARCICADPDMFTEADATAAAKEVAARQSEELAAAIGQVLEQAGISEADFIVSGHGGFLLKRALEDTELGTKLITLTDCLSPEVARCGPAHALAVLESETIGRWD